METIYPSRDKFRKCSRKNIFNLLNINNKFRYNECDIDHIIPFCISNDNRITNLQILEKDFHKLKTKIDLHILKILRKDGYYEKITYYSLQLLKPKREVIKRFKELLEQVEQEEQATSLNFLYGNLS